MEAGGVKLTSAWVSPAVAMPMVGAPGTIALTVKVWLTVAAALVETLPAWSALMVQLPAVTKVSTPAEVMVHTPVVDELKLTARPELEVADRVGLLPKFCAPGLPNVMAWSALGVTAAVALEEGLVPTALVAVTVKV